MKPKKNLDRVIISREEAEREAVAKKLQAQGNAAFGDPNERFDVSADRSDINMFAGTNICPDDNEEALRREQQLAAITTAGFGGNQMTEETKTPVAQEPAVEHPVVTNPNGPGEEPTEEVQEFSDDPAVKSQQISELMSAVHPNFPSGPQLTAWKGAFNEIFITEMGSKAFIYRYLKRQEWIQTNANEAFAAMRPDQKQDVIYNKCVIWPILPPDAVAGLPAGCVESLVNAIERNSLFLDPREVAAMTIKL